MYAVASLDPREPAPSVSRGSAPMPMRNWFQVMVVFTAVLGLGVGAAFGGGVLYGRRHPVKAATTTASAAPGGATAGAGGAAAAGGAGGAGAAAGGGGFAGGGGAPTTGVVEEVVGDTVSVRGQGGGIVPVKLVADTQIRQLASALPSDIKPGLNVIVQGQPDTDGKVAARSVQITGPATQGGGAPGGGRAGGSPGPSGAPGGAPRGSGAPTPAGSPAPNASPAGGR